MLNNFGDTDYFFFLHKAFQVGMQSTLGIFIIILKQRIQISFGSSFSVGKLVVRNWPYKAQNTSALPKK